MVQGNPLENAEIVVSGITLREEPFKQYNVRVTPDDDVIRYSIPIKKKDGSFTKVYDVYKANKAKLEENFAEDNCIKMKVAYSEKAVETQAGARKYRTIRAMEITGVAPKTIEEAPKEEEKPEEMDIQDIPF